MLPHEYSCDHVKELPNDEELQLFTLSNIYRPKNYVDARDLVDVYQQCSGVIKKNMELSKYGSDNGLLFPWSMNLYPDGTTLLCQL